jgi:hypothetical protein
MNSSSAAAGVGLCECNGDSSVDLAQDDGDIVTFHCV